ncbi:CPCC family cysteine-rich protein [Sphingopyxis fribergensis]
MESAAKFPCPCCRCLTISEEAEWEICPVCFWEDDGQDESEADEARCGPNQGISLTQARRNFLVIGACCPEMLKNVRPPLPDEVPD